MRRRFNGDTCCSCGGGTVDYCCEGVAITHLDNNYIDSLVFPQQQSDLTWSTVEVVDTPIEFLKSDLTWNPIPIGTPEVVNSPCGASQRQIIDNGTPVYGTGAWDLSARWGLWDSLAGTPAPSRVMTQSTGAVFKGLFDIALPLPDSSGGAWTPNKRLNLKANGAGYPEYWKKVYPPQRAAYLSGTTWDASTDNGIVNWPTFGTLTLRFPLRVNYCWPASGTIVQTDWCNFADATFTNGSYYNSFLGPAISQTGGQSWSYDSTRADSQLEIPFDGWNVRLIESDTAGALDLYLGTNTLPSDTFVTSGSCGSTVSWTSTSNPTHTLSFDVVGAESCSACGDYVPEASGCCTLTDGTVDPFSTLSACNAAGGTYGGDDSTCPPTGCCALAGSPDLSDVTEAHCTAQGGSWTQGAECAATGYCQDPSTGVVTEDVEQNDCTGTWSATPFPTGCCAITGAADQSGKNQVECTALGGTWTEGVACGTGWCVDNTTGAITAGVEEDECSGTWSATEPISGCCTISGTQNPDVAESWCTSQSGTFVAGDCPAPSFDPCGESYAATMNSFALEMNDPNFDLANPFYMYDGSYTQDPNALRKDVCSSFGAQLDVLVVDAYGANTADPTQVSLASNTDVKYNSTTGLWAVEAYVTWSYLGATYTITASKSGISIPSAGCPTITVSGTFDTFSGNYVQYGGGNTFTVNDLVGSFNITLTCE